MATITQLEYVISVDKHRHFGKAADACFVSQPSLSMQLQKLEDEIGVVIFDRSKKPIIPTEKGKEIIAQARTVLKEHEKLLHISANLDGQLSGELRVGIIPTLAPYVLPLFVESFSKDYPEITLVIQEYKTEDILRHLEMDELDLGLLVTPVADESIKKRILYYEPFYVYSNVNHPFHKLKKISPNELSLKDVWLLKEGHCFRQQIINLCSSNKKESKFANIQFESGSLETMKYLVDSIGGYTLIPHLCAKSLIGKDYVKSVQEFDGLVPIREISIVTKRDFLKKNLIDVLEKSIMDHKPKELSHEVQKNQTVVSIT